MASAEESSPDLLELIPYPILGQGEMAGVRGEFRGVHGGFFVADSSIEITLKPSCSKCRSAVALSVIPSAHMQAIEMQSVRLYSLSGRAAWSRRPADNPIEGIGALVRGTARGWFRCWGMA